jgi:hypothetical protein
MRPLVWIAVCLSLCLPGQAAEKLRTWTDVQGHTMRAEFVREVDGDATFIKDGKLLTIPLDRLIEADRQVIHGLEADKKVEVEAVPAGAPANIPPAAAVPASPADGGAAAAAASLSKKEAAIAVRVWTDTQGNRVTAKFVRLVGGEVVLLRGARTLTLPFDSLSAVDQAYIREVLTARGEQAAVPGSAPIADNPPTDAPADFANPPPTPPAAPEQQEAGPEPKIGRGNSGFFDKLHQRDEERRQQQAEHAAATGQPAANNSPEPTENGTEAATAPETSARSSDVPAGGRAGGGLRTSKAPLDRETVRDLRGAVIIVGVAAGVLVTVGIIVFIAITIAAASTPRKRREYS